MNKVASRLACMLDDKVENSQLMLQTFMDSDWLSTVQVLEDTPSLFKIRIMRTRVENLLSTKFVSYEWDTFVDLLTQAMFDTYMTVENIEMLEIEDVGFTVDYDKNQLVINVGDVGNIL